MNVRNLANGKFVTNQNELIVVKNSALLFKKFGANTYSLGLNASFPISSKLSLNTQFGLEYFNSVLNKHTNMKQTYRAGVVGLSLGYLL